MVRMHVLHELEDGVCELDVTCVFNLTDWQDTLNKETQKGLHEPHEVESNDSLFIISFKGLLNTTKDLQENLWITGISRGACFDLEGNLQTVWTWISWSLTALLHNKWPAKAEDVPWNDFLSKAPGAQKSLKHQLFEVPGATAHSTYLDGMHVWTWASPSLFGKHHL